MRALGITLGDITGIGPEVALKALAREVIADEDTRYVLIGDHGVVRELCGLLGVEADLPCWSERESIASRVYVHDPKAAPLPRDLPAGAPEAAVAAVRWLREGARLCLAGELAGMVTAPVSKEAIIRAGQPFIGQTEFLSELAGTKRTTMMLLGPDDRGRWLRVALATTHLPLKDVAAALTVEGVAQSIELAAEACARLGLARRRIAVCGLNPHAGEGGKVGREELDVIAPAVARAKSRGVDCHGPSAADTLFHQVFRGDFDAVVAMYHDQGLVPLKMVAFDTGVNWTLGLPFVRTSPDHGTAYDLAGRGLANPSSMEAAIRLARELAGNAPMAIGNMPVGGPK